MFLYCGLCKRKQPFKGTIVCCGRTYTDKPQDCVPVEMRRGKPVIRKGRR